MKKAKQLVTYDMQCVVCNKGHYERGRLDRTKDNPGLFQTLYHLPERKCR